CRVAAGPRPGVDGVRGQGRTYLGRSHDAAPDDNGPALRRAADNTADLWPRRRSLPRRGFPRGRARAPGLVPEPGGPPRDPGAGDGRSLQGTRPRGDIRGEAGALEDDGRDLAG